jgi:hypothetical protein
MLNASLSVSRRALFREKLFGSNLRIYAGLDSFQFFDTIGEIDALLFTNVLRTFVNRSS